MFLIGIIFGYAIDFILELIEKNNGKTKVAKISKAEVMKIAETKMPDLNAASIEAAYSMICGTARSMGITVEE